MESLQREDIRMIGERMRLVKLQMKELVYDESNQGIEIWIDQGNIYAEKWERHGKEEVESGAIVAVQDVRWEIRYRTLNPADYRIVEGTRVYDITSIQEVGRRKKLRFMSDLRDNVYDDTSVYIVSDGYYISTNNRFLINGN